jgi:hypothetical protein
MRPIMLEKVKNSTWQQQQQQQENTAASCTPGQYTHLTATAYPTGHC